MKKILIADDSALMRKTLCDIITSQQTENIEIDTCMDGDNACRKIIENRPDLAIIDLYLPKMNASEIVAQMQEYDTMVPMILIGSSVIEDTDAGSLVAGMNEITYVVRPFRIFGEQSVAFGETILREADALMRRTGKKQISERPTTISTPVAASRTPATSPGTGSSQPSRVLSVRNVDRSSTQVNQPREQRTERRVSSNAKRIVAIASSTGGPQALHRMIPMLPANVGVPIVVVQHMPKGFTFSLADRINQSSKLRVKEAEDGEVLMPNVVYIAPGGRHLEIQDKNGRGVCHVYDAPPVNNLRPCADVTYYSLANCSYDNLVCVVLTGMGHDGSDGIGRLKRSRRVHVISQSQETCVVYGMPKGVDQRGLTDESVPIDKIADAIAKELGVK